MLRRARTCAVVALELGGIILLSVATLLLSEETKRGVDRQLGGEEIWCEECNAWHPPGCGCLLVAESCEHCGGSGMLNVESCDDPLEQVWETEGGEMRRGRWVGEASWCHACHRGKMWRELGM